MCGIIAMGSRAPIDLNQFIKMRDTMIHRGPDDAGIFLSGDERVALGHRRLSIIDLSEKGRQPLCNEDGTIWLSFNGEIYNFEDLKNILIVKGHSFRSKTDSEVIVHAYETVDWNIVYSILTQHLQDFQVYAKEVLEWYESQKKEKNQSVQS